MEQLKVTKIFHKLRGVCQSSVVEASDGNMYVLKIAGPHAPNLLFNESFGTELLQHFGLPVPQWKPLWLASDFINSHPDLWFRSGVHLVKPAEGLYFGSRIILQAGNAGMYQIIPSFWMRRVSNRSDFIGALAIDIWTNHCDRRQAIYARQGDRFTATFIDNGHMFGGLSGTDLTCPRRCMNPDFSVYEGLRIVSRLERWRRRIEETDPLHMRTLMEGIPSGWYTPEMIDLTLTMLQLRSHKLGGLFSEVEEIMESQHSLGSIEYVNSLEEGDAGEPGDEL